MQAIDASVVLAPYLEPVVRGRRVAVFGDATRPLAPALLERGARLVHIYDPDAARVAEVLALRGSSRTLMTAPLPDGDVAVRDGAFDAVVVPDLTLFDPVDVVVAQARRLVATHGHAVFVSPNPELLPGGVEIPRERLLSYYELYDVIALQFPEVRMLGQSPFAGYVIADFAPEGDPDVVVDTSLVEREAQEPRWFMALGTQQPRRLDPYTIVQVPGEVGGEAAGDAVTRTRLQERLVSLEKALEQAKAKSAVPIVPRVPVSNERVEALEASLREREEALRRAESRAGDNHVRAGQLEGKVRDLEDELRRQRDRAFRLSNELEEEKKQRTKADLELRMVRSKSNMPPAQEPGPDARAETVRLERALEEANQQIAKLESELANLHTRLADTERALSSARDELDDLVAAKTQIEARVIELQREVAGRDARIEELDGIVVDLQEATGDAELEQALEDARRALEQTQAELGVARTDRDELVESLALVERARDEAMALVKAREAELAETQTRVVASKAVDPTAFDRALRERDEAHASLEALREEQEREVSSLERTLRERGREVQRLQRDIAHHERLVRELVVRLEETGETGTSSREPDGALRERYNELSAAFARREGELQKAQWRLAELELRVRDQDGVPEASGPTTELEHALFAAQNEMDALRQALAAERQARVRAESAVSHEQADRQAEEQERIVLEDSLDTPADSDPEAG